MARGALWSVLAALGLLAVALWRSHEPASRATALERAQTASPSDEGPSPRFASSPPPATAPSPSMAPAVSLAAEAPLDEVTLMARLRSVKERDPTLAIDLAREGNRRFPESPDAPERASILIHSLARQGLASEARGEAEDMVNAYPDSPWVREIEQFTGAHRHRNLRFGGDGGIEFY